MTKENIISVIMGSNSDFPIMNEACKILEDFGINYEKKIISAHRTPDRLCQFAKNAKKNNIKAIIAGAGGAAHLPGMVASMTIIPVFGVPIASKNLKGMDSLLSIVQMPYGVPVGSLAIGEAGAKNAALMAIAILALNNDNIAKKLEDFRKKQTNSIALEPHL
ncbi:5-(carboxyamino)imidazole ribonucleotide mutase [Rickettsiales bacterium]|nr:5-(carboxyamino)imidazole ribonucleotide mutase [Rickettsiales bacterium]